jgi:uncharacterized LabA/DUF88 family protein
VDSRLAIFIDGGYLDYVIRDLGFSNKVDYRRFAETLSAGRDLLRTYYYHCLPYQSPTPTDEERLRFGTMQSFLAMLDQQPRFTVRRGKLARRGTRADGTPLFEQKQVDILMATDIVMLSAKHLVTEIVLVTGDSDFIPAIRVAKDEGVVVRLVHGVQRNRPHQDLWDEVDERTVVDAGLLSSVLRQ